MLKPSFTDEKNHNKESGIFCAHFCLQKQYIFLHKICVLRVRSHGIRQKIPGFQTNTGRCNYRGSVANFQGG